MINKRSFFIEYKLFLSIFALGIILFLITLSFNVKALENNTNNTTTNTTTNLSNPNLYPDHVIISEVLYNPNGTETGREAVELYNPSDSDIDIGGWSLRTVSSNKDAVIPQNTIIKSKSYFLIADSGWSQDKDQGWVLADYEESITLSNTDAGVSLVNTENLSVDSVGWGSASNVNPNLFEGTPSEEVNDGHSLSRKMQNNTFIDTNNNSFDFYETVPNLKNSNSTLSSSNELNLKFEVVEIPILINSFNMTDDIDSQGFQVLPIPDGNKTVRISVNVSPRDAVVNCTISKLGTRKTYFNQSNSLFTCEFQIPYYQEPGLYNISIIAYYDNRTSVYNNRFNLMELLALKLDSSSISVGQILQGETKIISGDLDITTPEKPTVMNIGNVDSNLQITSSEISSSENTFSLSDIEVSCTPDFSNFNRPLNSTNHLNIELSPSDKLPLYFKIKVPLNQQKGAYSGVITINAVG